METLFNKISSYNLFNNLIPGIIFIVLSDKLIGTTICENELVITLFIAYFVGIIISRFGSIVIEKILKYFTKSNTESYEKYLNSCKKDEKISILLQEKTLYRNICSMLILLLLVKVFSLINSLLKINNNFLIIVVLICLIILFSLSYIKQNKYVYERIKFTKNEE